MNWRLVFTGLKSSGWVTVSVLSVLVAGALCLWLLKLERRLVSRPVGWLLVSLRLAILALLLLTLLQPVLTKQFDVSVRGRVVIAVDASHSMETQDRHAILSEQLRWAQALGMLGNQSTRPLIDRWVTEAEAGRTPDWLGPGEDPESPASGYLATARARQVADALDELSTMPRTEFVRRLLQSQPAALLRNLAEVLPTDLRLFAASSGIARDAELASRLASNREDLIPSGTDVLHLLDRITSEEDAGQVRGIVLLSDGRQTAAGDVTEAAARLRSLNVPVFAVPIGSRMTPRDLSIVTADAPETVFVNDQAEIRAVIGTAGFQGQELTVQLLRDGVPVDQQTVTPVSDSATVTFVVPSNQTGRYQYQIQTGSQPGELRTDNNSRDLSLQVVDNKARVMLVEGDARWEFRYLKNLLDRDKQVEPIFVLFHQPYMEILNQPFLPARLPDPEEFRKQLATTDLLILGDLAPASVSTPVWEAVEDAVARDGLTLLIIPGRNFMPHQFQSQILADLLPVTAITSRMAEQFKASDPEGDPSGFRMQPRADREAIPMLRMTAEAAGSIAALRQLPGHPWICSGTPKPGATVWADATMENANFEPEPVLVHHDYGFGQVVWLGLDSTWRWRFRAGDQWHYRFWGQLIRWASRNKSFAGDDAVRMTLTDVVVDESEVAEVHVRWDPRLVPQLEGAVFEAFASPAESKPPDGSTPSDPVVTEPAASKPHFATVLKPESDAPERFSGRLPRLPAGLWTITLKMTGARLPAVPELSTELLVMKQASAELANVSCNREFLTQLAEGSGGRLIEPWDVTSLPALLKPPEESLQKLEERTLWDHWLLLPVFFTLLMSEWVIRKLHGLP